MQDPWLRMKNHVDEEMMMIINNNNKQDFAKCQSFDRVHYPLAE